MKKKSGKLVLSKETLHSIRGGSCTPSVSSCGAGSPKITGEYANSHCVCSAAASCQYGCAYTVN